MSLAQYLLHPFRTVKDVAHRFNAMVYRELSEPRPGDPAYINAPIKYDLINAPRFLALRVALGQVRGRRGHTINERIVEHPFVHRQLRGQKNAHILDVGCGESLLPIELASQGHHVVGIDLGHYGLTHPNFHFVQRDVLQADLSGFDVAIAVSVLEHCGMAAYGQAALDVPLDRAVIEKMASVVKSGGLLLLTVPFGKKGQTAWYRVYDRDALRELITGLGTVEELEHYCCSGDKDWVPASELEAARTDSVTGNFARAVACVAVRKS